MNPMFEKGDYNSRGAIAYDKLPSITLVVFQKTVNKQEI